MKRRALIVGLTKVLPSAYGGWDGDCPGCDLDSNRMADLCRQQKFDQIIKLQNSQATIAAVVDAASNLLQTSTMGDLVFIYVSGHGGQQPDASGDELDGMDETLCLWDGELNDDNLKNLWDCAAPGIRVFVITDTCNSGTNFRGRMTIDRSTPVEFEKIMEKANFNGQLIHYGGCDDGESSFGGDEGGVFTNNLLKAWKRGVNPRDHRMVQRVQKGLFSCIRSFVSSIFNKPPVQPARALSYRQWFFEALGMMPRNQKPTYKEYGNVTPEFKNGPALK